MKQNKAKQKNKRSETRQSAKKSNSEKREGSEGDKLPGYEGDEDVRKTSGQRRAGRAA